MSNVEQFKQQTIHKYEKWCRCFTKPAHV